jgi:hypothetical protein
MSTFSIHYQDKYTQNLKEAYSIFEVLERLYTNTPNWIYKLLKTRNFIVKLFGLQTEAPIPIDFKKIKEGDNFGFLIVEKISSQNATFRGDDKHLNFKIIFEIQNTTLSALTQVQFNNLWGRIYFYSILPFHKLILPLMLKSIQ